MTDQEIFLRNAMETHGDAVYRLALCRLQNTADAEDVYQDVFLRLLGQPAESWDGEHLKAWLLRTALNRCADLHRFRLRCPALSLEEIPDMARPADETADGAVRRNYGRRWPSCRKSCGRRCICTTPRATKPRRSPPCWASRRRRCAPGSAGRE